MGKQNHEVYKLIYRELIAVILMVLTVIISVSSTVYAVAEEKIKDVTFDKSELEIGYFIENLDRHFQAADNIGKQVTNNLILSGILSQKFNLANYSNIESVKVIQQFQQAVLNGVPYIKDVRTYELYNGIRVSTNSIEMIDTDQLNNVQKFSQEFSRQWLDPGEGCNIEPNHDNSRLLIPVHGYNQELRCIVIVEMNNEWIYEQVRTNDSHQNNNLGIFGTQGLPIYNEEFLNTADIQIDSASETDRRMTQKVHNERYLVTMEKSRINQWTYVAAVPESVIMPEITEIRKRIILIMAVFSIILILIITYSAKKLILQLFGFKHLMEHLDRTDLQAGVKNKLKMLDYQIGSVVSELANEKKQKLEMQYDLEQNKKELSKSYLYRLMQGDYSEAEWNSIAKKLNYNFQTYLCIIIDLKLDSTKYKNTLGYGKNIRDNVFYGASHILSALFKEHKDEYETNIVNSIHRSRIYALLCFRDSDFNNYQIHTDLYFYQNVLMQTMYCGSLIAIGGTVASPGEISQSREEAEALLKSKFMLSGNHLLYCEKRQREEYKYSNYNKLRQQLKAGLLNCSNNDIKKVFEEHKERIKKCYQEAGYLYCCKDIINTVYEISLEKGITDDIHYRRLTKYFPDIEGYFQDFDELIDTLADEMSEAVQTLQNTFYSPTIQKALDIIKEEYQENLSLQEVADTLKISEPYLSKTFKSEVGVSFKEYLTDMKMRKAKELMDYSHMTLKEIALCVGYNDYKQFNVIFKKQFGMTAGEYRKAFSKYN